MFGFTFAASVNGYKFYLLNSLILFDMVLHDFLGVKSSVPLLLIGLYAAYAITHGSWLLISKYSAMRNDENEEYKSQWNPWRMRLIGAIHAVSQALLLFWLYPRSY